MLGRAQSPIDQTDLVSEWVGQEDGTAKGPDEKTVRLLEDGNGIKIRRSAYFLMPEIHVGLSKQNEVPIVGHVDNDTPFRILKLSQGFVQLD